jgi:hypothetical protein
LDYQLETWNLELETAFTMATRSVRVFRLLHHHNGFAVASPPINFFGGGEWSRTILSMYSAPAFAKIEGRGMRDEG